MWRRVEGRAQLREVGVDLFHPRFRGFEVSLPSKGKRSLLLAGLSASWRLVAVVAVILLASVLVEAWKLYETRKQIERITDRQRLAVIQLNQQGLGLIPGAKAPTSGETWKDIVDDTEVRRSAVTRWAATATELDWTRLLTQTAPPDGRVVSIRSGPQGLVQMVGRVSYPADTERWAQNLASALGLEIRLSSMDVRRDGVYVTMAFTKKGGKGVDR